MSKLDAETLTIVKMSSRFAVCSCSSAWKETALAHVGAVSDSISRELAREFEAKLLAAMCCGPLGGPSIKKHQTAFTYRYGRYETVEVDDAGNIIEPPRRCPRCGPILACSDHWCGT